MEAMKPCKEMPMTSSPISGKELEKVLFLGSKKQIAEVTGYSLRRVQEVFKESPTRVIAVNRLLRGGKARADKATKPKHLTPCVTRYYPKGN